MYIIIWSDIYGYHHIDKDRHVIQFYDSFEEAEAAAEDVVTNQQPNSLEFHSYKIYRQQ